jgi:hypothetical protein
MNWDAIGAIGEIVGAAAVVLTLGYLALQIRHSKQATTDSNRIARSNGVREWLLVMASNDRLRESWDAFTNMNDFHMETSKQFGVEVDVASRAHYAAVYFFWLHWGQYASTMDEGDRQELQNLIQTWYATAPIKYQWDNSPIAKPIMHKPWIDFVDSVLHESNPFRDP